MKAVALWSPEEVERWLVQVGLQEYCSPSYRISGQQLLNLAPSDFRQPPLSLMSSDEGRQLLEKVETLRIEGHMEGHKNSHKNGHGHAKANGHANGHANGYANGYAKGLNSFRPDMVQILVPEPERPSYPTEWRKTGVAFVYALCCFVTTTVVISVVHERVPPKEQSPPLPDKFFDVFNRVQWAFSICEINGMLLVSLWLLQWGVLKHRSIVGRRFFFIVGTLYLYRCVTMYVTTLPVPGLHFRCSPKIFGDWEAQMRRVVKMIAGGGLSITGSHSMCGDYLYSGHTVMLTLTYLFIKEYSPKRFWLYHWICWTLSAVGIFCILLAHDHYTVDVVVAYFITTRLFWWYHTLANQKALKETSQTNPVSRVWWYRLFQYFEENVQGVVPRHFQLPFSWRALTAGRLGYARVDTVE